MDDLLKTAERLSIKISLAEERIAKLSRTNSKLVQFKHMVEESLADDDIKEYIDEDQATGFCSSDHISSNNANATTTKKSLNCTPTKLKESYIEDSLAHVHRFHDKPQSTPISKAPVYRSEPAVPQWQTGNDGSDDEENKTHDPHEQASTAAEQTASPYSRKTSPLSSALAPTPRRGKCFVFF